MPEPQSLPGRHAWAQKLPFFYGWLVVLLGAFTMFSTTPGQSDSFAMFFNSFVNELGWSRTFVSSFSSVGQYGRATCETLWPLLPDVG